jgi:hypothetical protein
MSHVESPYRFVLGSDVERDGMFLELRREESGRRELLLEVFRSDADGALSFSAARPCDVPFGTVERFIARARAELADPTGREAS